MRHVVVNVVRVARRAFRIGRRHDDTAFLDEGTTVEDRRRRLGIVPGRRPMRRPRAKVRLRGIGDVGVDRIGRVGALDFGDVLKEMPLAAVEEFRRADMAERRRQPEELGLAALLQALACHARAVDADLPARLREDFVDLIEILLDARPDARGRHRAVLAGIRIEIDAEVDRRVRGLSEIARKLHRGNGVLAPLIGGGGIRHVEIRAAVVAVLKNHIDEHARAFDRGQLGLGQGLALVVVADLADARAVSTVVVAADGFHTGILELREIGRRVEIEVDDLRAARRRADRGPARRDGTSAPAADAPSDCRICLRDSIQPPVSRIHAVAPWNPS